MKKTYTVWLLVLALAACLAVPALAAGLATSGKATAGAGSATLSIGLEDLAWKNNGKLTVTYPTSLRLASAEAGELLADALTELDTDTAGSVALYWASEAAYAGDGSLLELGFTGAAGSYTASVSVDELGDSTDVESYDVSFEIAGGAGGGSVVIPTETTPADGEPPDGGHEDCPSLAYVDLDITLWYHEFTDYVLANDLMNGTGTDTFKPNAEMTRGMLVTVLYRLAGSPESGGETAFTDLVPGAYYEKAVLWAWESGITSGVSDSLFAPGQPVTREQAVQFLYNYVTEYLGETPAAGADLGDFTDGGTVSPWARTAVSWAYAEGILEGYGDGILAPQVTTTRAQCAKFLTLLATRT